jgi:hypothetical protein
MSAHLFTLKCTQIAGMDGKIVQWSMEHVKMVEMPVVSERAVEVHTCVTLLSHCCRILVTLCHTVVTLLLP